MIPTTATNMLRLAAWGCVILLALLSLLPADDVVRTGLAGHAEHVMAYAGTAFLMGLGYRERRPMQIAGLLIAYTGALEVLQFLSPGRHPGLDDWTASTLGVLIGTSTAYLALALYARGRKAG